MTSYARLCLIIDASWVLSSAYIMLDFTFSMLGTETVNFMISRFSSGNGANLIRVHEVRIAS